MMLCVPDLRIGVMPTHAISRASRAVLPLLLAAFLPACGGKGGSNPAPTGPTAGTPATPAATPTPTATPPPTTGTGLPRSCQGLPPGVGTGLGCARGNSQFFNRVKDAVDVARTSTYRDPISGRSFDVVDNKSQILAARAYIQLIVDQLDAQGVCAVFDGEEISVRNSASDNENFDVITADGKTWVNYVVTCTPALPLPTPPPVPTVKRDPSCPLPASASYFCVRQDPELDFEVYGAQDDLIAEDRARPTPQIFDFRDRISGTDYGYRLINENLYHSELLKKLKGRGLCALFDGEEFNVKRGTNVYSENYDVTRQDGFAIRIYGASCRDASF